MNELQAKKLAKFLNVTTETIKYNYETSSLLRSFYEDLLKLKNW